MELFNIIMWSNIDTTTTTTTTTTTNNNNNNNNNNSNNLSFREQLKHNLIYKMSTGRLLCDTLRVTVYEIITCLYNYIFYGAKFKFQLT